jgi:hypothetical protein
MLEFVENQHPNLLHFHVMEDASGPFGKASLTRSEIAQGPKDRLGDAVQPALGRHFDVGNRPSIGITVRLPWMAGNVTLKDGRFA